MKTTIFYKTEKNQGIRLWRGLLECQANNIMGNNEWTYEHLNRVDSELLNAILEADEQLERETA
jgi:hypothetical protein